MPPHANDVVHTSKSVPAWYGKLGTRCVKPKPSDKTFWEKVLYKAEKQKPKQKTLPPLVDHITMPTEKLLVRNIIAHTTMFVQANG